jgi:hypothetical protein
MARVRWNGYKVLVRKPEGKIIILYICILSHIAISLFSEHTRNKGTNEHDWKETAIFLETSINT